MHVDTSNFKVSLQSPSAVINTVALQSQDHSGKALTPEGPHLCVGYVIVTAHCLCIPAMYGGNFAVRRLSHDAETLPPYLDESALVPEQEADGETAGSDQSACSERRFTACLERRDDRRLSQLVIWLQ